MDIKSALFISLVSHCFILGPLGNLGLFSPTKKINEPQVNYYKAPLLKAEIHKETDVKKASEAPRPAQIANEQKSPPAVEPRRLEQKPQMAEKAERPPCPPEAGEAEKPRETPSPKTQNIIPESIPGTTLPNTPECVTYYQYIREEIRRFLKRNYTSAYEEGDVGISFSLIQTGELSGIEIIDEKSSKDSRLRRLSYESIKTSAPFKPFPKGLPQKQIFFNLSIIFKHK